MKKYNEPELNVLHIGKEICTEDIIIASAYNGETTLAPGQRGLDDWDAGY